MFMTSEQIEKPTQKELELIDHLNADQMIEYGNWIINKWEVSGKYPTIAERITKATLMIDEIIEKEIFDD